MRSRGATVNPESRFEPLRTEVTAEEEAALADEMRPTELIPDPSRTIIATNQSPDIGFDASINPYRGCSHGCAYCYARPTHEYLGLSAGLDFETKILVKERAPELLRQRLMGRSWKPQVVALSGVTDAYQPAEQKLRITRRCLEVLADFRNPASIVTKSGLVTRDIDVLQDLARFDGCSVLLSITTLDPTLQHRMEPQAARPRRRLAAIEALANAGIPVGVMVAPIIPGLTDHETAPILEAASEAGASYASRVVLRLPHGVGEIFEAWLEEHYPERRRKVLNQVRGVRGGALYDTRWRHRQRGTGVVADHMEDTFALWMRRLGLAGRGPRLRTDEFRLPGGGAQLGLFS